MKKLRNAENYSIGLDIGTGSVGWCVVDNETGRLLTFKGRPTWGSRLFPSAETAEATRLKRGQRRRIQRRRQRLDLLQGFFAEEVEKVDPNFFIRLNASRLVLEDKQQTGLDAPWQIFDSYEEEKAYHEHYPTIYHLRKELIENPEQADIRLVYMALHNIVKYRGNFLQQDVSGLSAKSANISYSAQCFIEAFESYANTCEIDAEIDLPVFMEHFDSSKRRADVVDDTFCSLSCDDKTWKNSYKLCLKALVGYSIDFAKIFGLDEKVQFKLNEDDKIQEFYEVCPEEGHALFDAMRALYSSWILVGILGSADGGTISYAKVQEYDRYKNELRILKDLVKEYTPDKYNDFFRGPADELGRGGYSKNPKNLSGYTKYNFHKTSQEDFYKEIKKLLGAEAQNDRRYLNMLDSMDEFTFLRRQKTSDNGVIPYQLHLEEMRMIIENQKQYYPFLDENQDKIESLVSFRRPYYIGPLKQVNAPIASGKTRFAWAEKNEGMEDVALRPWNWEEVINKDKAAEDFIQRMVKTCSQLDGEPVLPKKSLLYQEFCVLNELNGVKYSLDGDAYKRFDYLDRCAIVNDLFKTGRKVKHIDVYNWYRKNHLGGIDLRGTQG